MNEEEKNLKIEGKIISFKGKEIEKKLQSEKQKLKHFESLGLCKDCEDLQAYETEYGNIFAKCGNTKMLLKASDPITHCSMYWKTGQMTLKELKEMAILINPSERKIGFINIEDDDEYE